ncbi:MAG: hypothetical protein ACYTGE_06625 [Planctomycetota bacterium]|jgi:hypothetical protein
MSSTQTPSTRNSRLQAWWSRAREFARRHDLVPHGRPPAGWRTLRPRGTGHWISCAILWAALATYVAFWVHAHADYLFNPLVQQGDARILFPFHQHADADLFRHDPIAQELTSYLTPGVAVLYRILTPLTGLYLASKIVQLVCLAILLWAGWLLVKSRRAGLAAGVLLVFLMLHTPVVPYRIAGGLPRSFAFPLFALWSAGALSRSERVRFSAAVIAAFTYLPATALILAAEGVHGVLSARLSRWAILPWLRRYALLVLACGAVGLAAAPGHDAGPIHTLAQARDNPAFGMDGRLKILPFPEPVPAAAWAVAAAYLPVGDSVLPVLARVPEALGSTSGLAVLTALMILVALRLTGPPRAALAFLCGSVVLYAAARLLAFRLYSPIRFTDYGLPAAGMFLGVAALGLLAGGLRPRPARATVRNVAAAGFIAAICLFNGDGLMPNAALSADGREHQGLHAFIRGLPADARIACHPLDADDVAYWGQRSATDGHEMITIWLTEDWKRQKQRTEDTLLALYATDPGALLGYCRRYEITHILISTERYGPDFREHAGLFEPFTQLTTDHLSTTPQRNLVVLKTPAAAVIFDEPPYLLIDAQVLDAAWHRPYAAADQALSD